jgi:ribosomal protein S18 acetylase RimI-like enzyme
MKPQPPEITLDPMTEEEFAAWLLPAVRERAEENVKSGRWAPDEALQMAKTEFAIMLPNTVQTKGNLLYTVRDSAGGAGVGSVWIAMHRKANRPEAYIYDLVISAEQRGRGYGRAAMLAAIARARELGAESVGLHVFGHNAVARELYRSLGFVETNIQMSLPLDRHPAGSDDVDSAD